MFKNEPLTDFTVEENRRAMSEALARLDDRIASGGLVAYPIVNGQQLRTAHTIPSVDPAAPHVTIGTVHFASTADANLALRSLRHGLASWESTAMERRCEALRNAANRMRARRFDLAALIIREAGKPWREADADVAEAIDFCDYYAEEYAKLGEPRRTMEVPGEENVMLYQPRGVAVVISPWNFPLAIATGMTVAALVTGNTTVLKPAEQTSLIAYELAQLLLESGVPSSAFAFLPGVGEEVGRELVHSPEVDVICFTGSKGVGLEIIENASRVLPGQRNVKRVIAEMGGKNAIIVDDDADLDEAVKGVIASAFGYAGQKCSACSRLIVVGDAYEPLIERLREAAHDLVIGAPSEPATLLGPVIDDVAQQRILSTIERAERELSLLFKGQTPEAGYYVPATIFRDVPTTSFIWKEEIFGPVLACRPARSFDEAIAMATDSQYALTGGLFSRSPSHIEQAKRQFKVGNLYINRGCTGALVCRQPFGGFKMSGVGSKAGGPDYLLQFVEPRVITENTMRRGFAPEHT